VLLGLRQDDVRVDPVMAAQLRGVLDDDADAARELEVLEHECDAQVAYRTAA
jgi:hypothetical protein